MIANIAAANWLHHQTVDIDMLTVLPLCKSLRPFAMSSHTCNFQGKIPLLSG